MSVRRVGEAQRAAGRNPGCARGTARRPLRSPPARSSRSRRPGGRPAARSGRGGRGCAAAASASAAKSSSVRRHLMSGSRRRVPRPEQGASIRTQSNTAPNGSACAAFAWTTRTQRGARRRGRCRPAAGPAWLGRPPPRAARDCPWRPPSRSSCRRARRTRRARARRDARAATRHELRRLVLDDEQPCARERRQQGIAAAARSGRRARSARARVSTPAAAAPRRARRASMRKPIGPQRQRRRLVVEAAPRFGRLEPVAVAPARDEPARVRQRRRQVVELARRGRRPRRGGSGSRSRSRLARRRTALTTARRCSCRPCASSSTASLTAADAGTRSRWSSWNSVSRRMSTTSGSSVSSGRPANAAITMIERALPAQRAGGDFAGQRAVALVVQARSARGRGPRADRRGRC